ncbi:hypothetical protein GCM10027184_52250 [Saccharothrix stipae]
MNGAEKLGRLGLAIAVVIASVVLSATPARADGIVRYENVGNPGWCMSATAGDETLSKVLLVSCNNSDSRQRWLWSVQPTGPMAGMIMLSESSYPRVYCLTNIHGWAAIDTCDVDNNDQYWSVWGQNGWVVYQLANTLLCLRPYNTHVVGSYYEIVLFPCPVRTNVPNIFAWRY